jgi:nucleoid-associated protein YgaU
MEFSMNIWEFIKDLFRVEESYIVKKGDNLTKIAKKYPRVSWKDIYEANRDVIEDKNLIYPDQVLRIPRK